MFKDAKFSLDEANFEVFFFFFRRFVAIFFFLFLMEGTKFWRFIFSIPFLNDECMMYDESMPKTVCSFTL